MSQCETRSPLAPSPQLPKSADGEPVFPEPWAAEAFAMTVHLHERGLFTWGEWAQTPYPRSCTRPGRARTAATISIAEVAAFRRSGSNAALPTPTRSSALQESWQRAAEATPQGKPIELANDPLR